MHHLSTKARRVQAVEAVLRVLNVQSPGKRGGQALIFVWALEQKTSRRGWDVGHEQDVLVPWVMQKCPRPEDSAVAARTHERYYHLYQKGELEQDVLAAGGCILDTGYDRDNWWVVAAPKEGTAQEQGESQ